ncbi:MAG: GNVR domain-containing protein [bacterium]
MTADAQRSPVGDLEVVCQVCRSYWRSISLVILVALVVGIVVVLILPVEYQAEAHIFPAALLRDQGGMMPANALMGVTRQLGLDLGGGNGDPSLLFPAILGSRKFAHRILQRTYTTRDGELSSLVNLLVAGEENDAGRLERAYSKYTKDGLRTEFKAETGVTTISYIHTDSRVAAAVANHCVAELEVYTRELKAADSNQRAGFIDGRLADVKNALATSEETLKLFRENNRNILGSPNLMLQESRLIRDVELNQQLFITLKQQLELARIEAVKDVAVISILDDAVVPLDKFRPRRGLIMIFVLLAASLMGIGSALVRHHRAGPDGWS